MIKLKQMILSLKQLHKSDGIFYSIFVSGNGRGLFFKSSHIAQGSGQLKIPYSTYEKARKAADKMELREFKHDLDTFTQVLLFPMPLNIYTSYALA